MNVGISKLSTNLVGGGVESVSVEDMFNTEIAFSIANEALTDCLKEGDELQRVIDNIDDLQSVAKTYHSKECLNVINSLTDGQLYSYSAEGFFSDAWAKIKAFCKKLWNKIVSFFKWLWQKIKSLFGSKSKVRCTKRSALGKIAQKNPKVAACVTVTQGSTQSLYSFEAMESESGINLANLTALMDAMKTNTMSSGVKITVITDEIFSRMLARFEQAARLINRAIKDVISAASNPDVKAKIQNRKYTAGDDAAEFAESELDEINNMLNAQTDAVTAGGVHGYGMEVKTFKTYYEVYKYCVNLATYERKCQTIATQAQQVTKALNESISQLERQADAADDAEFARKCVNEIKGVVKCATTLDTYAYKLSQSVVKAITAMLSKATELFSMNNLVVADETEDVLDQAEHINNNLH